MSNDENKCEKIQSSTIPKSKVSTSENVVAHEVKILNRGDLLGAINCLFPELQLKNIKLKENFSLFSNSLQELTRIFESGRKYRSRTLKNIKLCNANQSLRSQRTDFSKINSKRNTAKTVTTLTSSKNTVHASKNWMSKAQKKKLTHEMEPSKRYETVQFQSNYTDFAATILDSHFPDRYVDFKNIECIIQELHNMYKDISKEDKIAPFNPNLPVLNISNCDEVRRKSGSKDILKSTSTTSAKHIRNKKKSRSRSQIEVKGKRKKSRVNAASTIESISKLADDDDSDDENGKEIVQNIESLLSGDTFSPRYKAKLTSDVSMRFRKSINKTDSIIFSTLEKEAIEQYENIDDAVDMNFDLF